MVNGSQARAGETTLSDSSLNKKRDIHKELSTTVRRTMFTMLAYSAFCMIIVAQPDVPFVLSGSGVKIPVINAAVNIKAFLLVGPLGLLLITFYLHLFLAKLDRVTGLKEDDKQPFLFNFQDRLSRFLIFLVFYATPPIVMVGFSWKSAIYWWWVLMYFATMLVTVGMFLLYKKSSRRSLSTKQPTDNKAKPQSTTWRRLLWFLKVIIVIGIVALPGMIFWGGNLTRGLHLERAQLSGITLRKVQLARANLKNADLSKADLRGADLRWALLKGAYLHETNLREAKLNDADLTEAFLSRANLTYANLSKADLNHAYLRDADLRGADLSEARLLGGNFAGADLRDANLTVSQVCRLISTLYKAKLDPVLEKQINEKCPGVLKQPVWWK
jgi:hypothetical protein